MTCMYAHSLPGHDTHSGNRWKITLRRLQEWLRGFATVLGAENGDVWLGFDMILESISRRIVL